MEVIPVVAGCIIENGKVLLGLRERSKSPETIGMWEMLGGKIEEGETPEEALKREIEEELGLLVRVGRLLHASINSYSEGTTYLVLFYYCSRIGSRGSGEGIKTKWSLPGSEEYRRTLPGAREAIAKLSGESI